MAIHPCPKATSTGWRNSKSKLPRPPQLASLSVNAELVQLYGRVGRDILERQQTQGWCAKVIDRLALDLKSDMLFRLVVL